MATKKTEAAAEETASTAVELISKGEVALSDELKSYLGKGIETMEREDVAIPRLAIAQALSPQLSEDDPEYIPNLKAGDMFNTLTGQIYGRGPLVFAIIRRDPPRAVEFFPLDEGGGIKDLNVPLTDPRCQFGEDGSNPIATKFYDFVIVLFPQFETLALSFKSSGLKVARALNGLIIMRSKTIPLFLGCYSITSVKEVGKKGTFFIPRVSNAGVIADPAAQVTLMQSFESFKEKELVIERTSDEAEGAEMSGAPVVEDVPF